MNYIISILRGTKKAENLSFITLYFILSIFYLTAQHLVFNAGSEDMSNAVLIYLVITTFALMLSNRIHYKFEVQRVLDRDLFFMRIVYMLVIYFLYVIVFSFVSLPGGMPIGAMFSSVLWAVLYAIFIVGYPETIIFSEVLPYRVGAVLASLFFALVHYGALSMAFGSAFVFSIVMLEKLAAIFFANLIFIYIRRTTGSRFITAYAHGLYDLFVWGVL